MSSRDGSGQPGNKRRSAHSEPSFPPSTGQGTYDIDPAEIDRYLSGKPQRTTRPATQTDRASAHTTPDQLNRLRRMVDPPDASPSGASRREAPATNRKPSPPAPRPVPARRQTTAAPAGAYPFDGDYVEDDGEAEGYDYYDAYPGQWDEEGDPALAGQTRRGRPAPSMPSVPRLTIPRSITGAAILADRTALLFIAVSIASLIGMAVLVSNRMPTLPPEIATHVSASGVLGNFGPSSLVWRIPLLALMLTLMNLVIGIFAARFDRFASRLVLAAGLVVQFLAWVALIRIL